MTNETEKAKWIRLIKQVRDTTTESTDWKGISEISQIAMYGAVVLFTGIAISEIAKIKQETKSERTGGTAKEKDI